MPSLFARITSLIGSKNEWKHRFAGVEAITNCAAGCKFVLKNHLQDILNLVVPLIEDPHPCVRWAVLNCLAELFIVFDPTLGNKFGNQLMPLLLAHFNDNCARVQGQACVAVTHFSGHCDPPVLAAWLDQILPALAQMLQSPVPALRDIGLTTLSCLIEASDINFTKYYDTFVPYLKTLLCTPPTKETRGYRGKAMECLSVIGKAVKKERFSKDALEIMSEMLKTQVLEADDPQIADMETAFARIAECLGLDFIPYLQFVMPAVIARASVKPDPMAFSDEQATEGIHTTQLDDKSGAAHIILVYATHLKHGFFPYVEPMAKMYVEDMRFALHEGVRLAAAASAPLLLKCVLEYMKVSGTFDWNYTFRLWHYYFEALMTAALEERDLEVLAVQLSSVQECLEAISKPCLSSDQCKKMVSVFCQLIGEWKERRVLREAIKRKEGYDEETIEKMSDEEVCEDEVLGELVEGFSQLARFHGDVYIPLFKSTIYPLVVDMLTPDKPWNERQKALCFFDDIVEHGGALAESLFGQLITPMFQYAQDANPHVRQAALCGLGMCSQFLTTSFTAVVQEGIRSILAAIQAPNAREDESAVRATENGISSLGKICRYQTSVNVSELLPIFLDMLPLTEDDEEGIMCHDNFMALLENPGTSAILFGQDFRNMPKIVKVIAQVVDTKFASSEFGRKAASLFRTLQTTLPAQVLQGAWNALSPEEMQRVSQLAAAS